LSGRKELGAELWRQRLGEKDWWWFPGVLGPAPSKYLISICAAEARSSGLTIAISRIFETESTLEAADKTARWTSATDLK
jgi:hypothetical protein